MRPRAILFDAGNTIVYFDVEAASDVLRRAGALVTAAALRSAEGPAKRAYERELSAGGSHGDTWYSYMSCLLSTAGVERARVAQLVRALREEHDRFNLWRFVPPGLPESLDRERARGTILGVVSNSEGRVAELLARVDLARRFAVIVDSGVEGVQKPDPEIWHRALERIGVSPADALYVGDAPTIDVEGARGAGLAGVLVDPYAQYDDDERVLDAGSGAASIDPRDWRAGPIVRFRSVADLLDALRP